MFSVQPPHVVEADEGYSVELKQGAGLIYSDAAGQVEIDSEFLVGAPPSIGIFPTPFKTPNGAALTDERKALAMSRTKAALNFVGWNVVWIG